MIDHLDQVHVLAEWQYALRREQTCHLRCVAQSDTARVRYGSWSSALAAIVGTSIFLTLQQQPEMWIRILVGLTSILAAVLSAIQVYVKGSDRLEEHRDAAAKFDCLRREIEAELTAPPSARDWHKFETDFRGRWKDLTDKAPPYSQKILAAAEEHMKRRIPFDFPYLKHAA